MMKVRFLPVVLVALASASAYAQEEDTSRVDPREYLDPEFREYRFWKGRITDRLKLNGTVSIEEWFDNNVLISEQKESDTITYTTLDVGAAWGNRHIDVDFSYTGRDRRYASHDEFSGLEHLADAKIGFKIEHFRLGLTDNYQQRIEPNELTLFVQRVTRQQNDLGASAGVDFEHFSINLFGVRRDFHVKDSLPVNFDFERTELGIFATYTLTLKLKLQAEVGRRTTAFEDASAFNDFTTRWFALGIEFQPSALIHADIRFGPLRVEVDSPTAGAIPVRDTSDVYVRGLLQWRTDQRSTLSLSVERGPEEYINGGYTMLTRVTFGYDRWLSQRMIGGVYIAVERAEDPDRDSTRTSIVSQGQVTYDIGRNWGLEVGVLFRNAKFSDSHIDNIQGHVGVSVGF